MISSPESVTKQAIPSANKSTDPQLLIPNKFITHHPKFGLNPLVDAAAYLFSLAGKLKQLDDHHHLTNLSQELFHELDTFQEAAKNQGYTSEFIVVARFALAATLDDIIANTPWGSQGQWQDLSLLAKLNQDNTPADRFFIILERISKDPATYIDVMELMYICLSLGFKGHYRSTEFNNNQLEQITYVLYKNIRVFRGNFSKALSPFPIRLPQAPKKIIVKKTSPTYIAIYTSLLIIGIFAGLGILLQLISNEVYQELMHIGKLILL